MKLGNPTTVHDVHRAMRLAIEMLSDSADRLERIVATKGPEALLNKEIYIQNRTIAGMDLLLGLMEGVYERQKQND